MGICQSDFFYDVDETYREESHHSSITVKASAMGRLYKNGSGDACEAMSFSIET